MRVAQNMRKIPLALLCARGVFFVSHGIVFFLSRNFLLFLTEVFFHTECTECTEFYLPQITQIKKIFYLPDLTIRSLAAQEVALQICTDFTPSELLFLTELFFFLTEVFFSLTEFTEFTEFTEPPMLRRLKILSLMLLFHTEVFLFHTELFFFLSRNARNARKCRCFAG